MAGCHIRVAWWWIGLLLFQADGRPALTPVVEVHWQESSRTLYVSIYPPPSSAPASFDVCVQKHLTHQCRGDKQQHESAKGSFRYTVTGLALNETYAVLVRPRDKNGRLLDRMWTRSRRDVTTTVLRKGEITPANTVQPDGGKRGEPVESRIQVWQIVAAVIGVVAAAVAVVYCLWRRDKVRGFFCLGCCLGRLVRNGPRREVLLLYLGENVKFTEVVKMHARLLAKHMPLRVLDWHTCDQRYLGHRTQRQALVYVSPELIHKLTRVIDADLGEHPVQPLAKVCAQLFSKQAVSGWRPVLVFTGCFQNDERYVQFMDKHSALRGYSRFWISKNQVLKPPHALLGKLSGFHRSFFASLRDWSEDTEAADLQRAIKMLWWHMDSPPRQDRPGTLGGETPTAEQVPQGEQDPLLADTPLGRSPESEAHPQNSPTLSPNSVPHLQNSAPDLQKNSASHLQDCVPQHQNSVPNFGSGEQDPLLADTPLGGSESLSQDSEIHLQNSQPHTSAPYLQNSPSHLQNSAPHLQSSPPHLQTSAPYLQNSPSHLQNSAPHLRSSPPHLQTSAPYLQNSPSHLQNSAPHLQSSPPHRMNFGSPYHNSVPQPPNFVLRHQNSASPHQSFGSPQHNVIPCDWDPIPPERCDEDSDSLTSAGLRQFNERSAWSLTDDNVIVDDH